MPITVTFSRDVLTDAAKAEGLTAAQVKEIIAAAPADWLNTLVSYMADAGGSGASLPKWRAAFPGVLKNGTDAADSFLIRVAVAAAGGIVV